MGWNCKVQFSNLITSFDTSWRLWDAETTQELLIQEGHSREVFCIGFQGDGALCATAGLDSVGRIWDLRTGRSIMALRSHIKPILALDWSPNGYQLATAGEDNTIRIWDIRSSACVYQVPAHTSLITSVRYWHATDAFDSNVFDDWTFEGRNLHSSNSGMDVDDGSVSQEVNRKAQLDGSFLLSSSYDGTCKLWTDGDFKPLGSLSGVEGKVMSADISGDAKHVVTALYDRTFKLYHSPKV
jgi:U4/U6 small nuclear ribonucleoprotein PRP4